MSDEEKLAYVYATLGKLVMGSVRPCEMGQVCRDVDKGAGYPLRVVGPADIEDYRVQSELVGDPYSGGFYNYFYRVESD